MSLKQIFFDDPMPLLSIGAIGLLILSIVGFANHRNEEIRKSKLKALAPIVSQVKLTNRPRVLIFSGSACSVCRKYEPIVKACADAYRGKVDFKIYNLDNSEDFNLGWDIGAGVPGTLILDQRGEEIYTHNGYLSRAQLEEHIQPALDYVVSSRK